MRPEDGILIPGVQYTDAELRAILLPSKLTKQRAHQILVDVWGCEKTLTLKQQREIDTVQLQGETNLQACLRVAEFKFDMPIYQNRGRLKLALGVFG